jgi:hypothetical protein
LELLRDFFSRPGCFLFGNNFFPVFTLGHTDPLFNYEISFTIMQNEFFCIIFLEFYKAFVKFV